MSFDTGRHFEQKFTIFEEVLGHVREEQQLYRLPVMGLLEQGARVEEDHPLSVDDEHFGFNEHNYGDLCRLIGVDSAFLSKRKFN